MFQEAFQKKLIIISCLLMAIAGFVAGTQMKSFRPAKMKSAQADTTVPFQNYTQL